MNNNGKVFNNLVKSVQTLPSLDMNLEEYGYENMDFIFDKPGIVQNLDELLKLCIETKFPDCLDLDISTSLKYVLRDISGDNIVGSCKLSHDNQVFEAFIIVDGMYRNDSFHPQNISITNENPFHNSENLCEIIEVPEREETHYPHS